MRHLPAMLALAALALPAVAQADSSMAMGGSPEHVASALSALQHGHPARAGRMLHTAAMTAAEPAGARTRARQALTALKAGHAAAARRQAVDGAAVEHLTYALAALRSGDVAMAGDHLREAARLAPVRTQAQTAIAALGRRAYGAAARAVRSGLSRVNP